MGYFDTPAKPIKLRDGNESGYASHDKDISMASDAGKYCDRTDAASQGAGYLGVDDLDRIRRKNLRHRTR